MRVLLGLLALLAALWVLVALLLFVFQRSLIYFPQPRQSTAPTEPLERADTIVQVTVRALPGADALIWFGGNAEDVSLNLNELAAAFPTHALYLMHYRGYGGSGGSPSEAALVADALALFDRVVARHSRVVVIGRSLGSGVAVQLASQRPVARLVLVTPYDSLAAIAAAQYPWLPVLWLIRDRFDSVKFAANIHVPTLLLTAENDTLIPLASSQRLAASFPPGVARLRMLPGVDHNSISTDPTYWRWVAGAAVDS